MLDEFFSRAQKTPLSASVLTLLAIVFLRIVLEQALEAQKRIEPPTSVFLFAVYFLAVLSGVFALAWLFSGRKPVQVLGVVAVFSPILLVPPFFDFIASGGAGYSLMFQFFAPDFWPAFASFCANCSGVSPGLRVEVALVMLAVAAYAGWARRSWLAAVASAVAVYALVVFAALFPGYLMAFLAHATTDLYLFREVASAFTLFSSAVFVLFLAFTTSFFRRLRIERSLHYAGLTLFGAFLGTGLWTHPFPGVLLPLAATVLSVLFAFETAVAVNDAADANADVHSNPKRVLLFEKSHAPALVAALLFFSLLNALSAGFAVVVWVAFAFALSLVYSLAPLRLSRHTVSAGLVVAACAAAVFLAGFGVGLLEPETVPGMLPWRSLLAVFGLVFLASPLKDLKDLAGDKKQGRFTLPVWLGVASARKATSALIFLATLWAAYWLSYPVFAAAGLGALAGACVLLIRNVGRMERAVFALEFVFFLSAVFLH